MPNFDTFVHYPFAEGPFKCYGTGKRDYCKIDKNVERVFVPKT